MIAENLTRQPDTGQGPGGEAFLLGRRVLLRFSGDELDTARRAARVAAAGMEDVHVRVLLDGEHEPLALRHIEYSVPFYGQLWHPGIVRERPPPP